MRSVSAVAVAATLLASTSASAAPAPDVATAARNLAAARTRLADAVKRIEVDAPVLSELDAAHEAVNALKDAIDAGAGQEPNDLDYARNALAARKEVRERRDFVDARRAKLHIFNHRRSIETAAEALRAKAAATEVKEPSSADFEQARAAVAELRRTVEPSRQFTRQDADFAKYVAQLDADTARLEKAVDEKWAAVEGSKHRARVEDARVSFETAYKALHPTATDEQFKAADGAGKHLEQRLDEGRVLESKDRTYGPWATRTRAELVTAKKRIDELWSQTGLARLKAEIEPTRQDLAGALKVVRQKRPPEDQLAEARTIAIVARKTLEKYQAEAARSEQFGAYVAGVRSTLEDVEGQLQLKALDLALRDFRGSLVKIEKNPGDDDFAVSNSALLVLTKTLEPMNVKNPALTAAIGEGRAWEREGRAKLTRRRLEIDVATQQAKVEAERNVAQKAVDAFSRAESGDDDVKAAETAVQGIVTALDAGKQLVEQDKTYAWYDREVRKRAADFTKKIENRKLQLFAAASRAELRAQLDDVKVKLEAARAPASTDADLEAATKAIDEANRFLEGKAQLEQQAGSYASAAEKGRFELMKRFETLALAQEERTVRKNTIDQLNVGMAAAAGADGEQNLKKQKAGYDKALAAFKSCRDEGTRLVEQSAQAAKLPVVLTGLPSTVRQAVAECSSRYDKVAPLLPPLVALVFVEDKPKRAWDAANALLAKGKKAEALNEFVNCAADSVTAGVRYPDLKERTFAIGREQLTLSELSKRCSAKERELRGK